MIKEIKKNRLKLEFNKIKNNINYLKYDVGIVGRIGFREIFILERTNDGEECLMINSKRIFKLMWSDYDEHIIDIFDDGIIDIISQFIKKGKDNLIIEYNVNNN